MTPSAPDATKHARTGEPPAASGAEPPADAVRAAARDAGLIAGLRDVYAVVDEGLDQRGARCSACGRCCDFARTGHRLYASTAELAMLASVPPPEPVMPGRCPYLRGQACGARDRRTLGCRTYFCDPDLREPGRDAYEAAHRAIRRLHETYGVGYHYMELTAGLAAALTGPDGGEFSR
ncbi:MAG: hypothetical protein KGY99_07195 [Phycisphaerae bacterium]|nr:hypothetical protein [Phycisphaerae bacterium]